MTGTNGDKGLPGKGKAQIHGLKWILKRAITLFALENKTFRTHVMLSTEVEVSMKHFK